MFNSIEPRVDFDTNYYNIIDGSATVEDKHRIGKELLEGLEKDGFVYLTNLGAIGEWVDEFKACGNAFFELPRETKEKYRRAYDTCHGYSYQLDERHDGCPTVHETFDITRVEEVPDEGVPNFKECSKYGKENLQALLRFIFSSLDLALDYKPNFFNDRCSFGDYEKNVADLRVIRHPPMVLEGETPIQRTFTHADLGILSLLFQDDVGGLEIRTSSGEWIEASPRIPNGCLMIAGQMMPKVTNGKISAVEHRVVTRKSYTTARRSVVFFAHLDYDVLLKSPTDSIDESTVTVRQFINKMMKTVYKECSEDA